MTEKKRKRPSRRRASVMNLVKGWLCDPVVFKVLIWLARVLWHGWDYILKRIDDLWSFYLRNREMSCKATLFGLCECSTTCRRPH